MTSVPTTEPVRSVALGDYHACLVEMDGDVKCRGSDSYGRMIVPSGMS